MLLDIDFLKNNHEFIHFFGLGFVQLKLDKNLRMHFYHPDLTAIISEEEVHNHRYNFISTILAGNFSQELFSVKAGPGDYIMVEENCKVDKIVNPSKIEVSIESLGVHHYSDGDSYVSLTSDFHRVSTSFAITRLYRGDIESENALVIRRKDQPSVCPFSKQLSIDECWQIVEDCIKIAKNIK